jgi:uncharacterized membrane protein
MLSCTWGILSALILAAPILLSLAYQKSASVFYLAFSFLCHQNPDRSFFLAGYPLPVCHRCLGIYFGLWIGSMIGFRLLPHACSFRRLYVAAAVAPILLDVALSLLGIWSGTEPVRFLTGLWFGFLISIFLLYGARELLADLSRRHFIHGNSFFKKGSSWIRKEC